ncbi:hypothetical protein [Kitasatospora sp. NPDC018619]|uniref:hypothetical protein n=1 Tax=unclassified Kitasatospora TaxID=2633591 RepID=UPI0037927944
MNARGTGPGRESVDQIVFRWQGNQGRRGAGLAAAAWSCPREEADDLGRELAPFLRVDGAPCPSVVRTRLRDGRAALVQRWPTADAGGRPSTAAHVLVGPSGLLGPRRCLGLRDWTWSGPEFAEQAHGGQPPVPTAELEAVAAPAWNDTLALLPEVRDALTAATAALLRDQRCCLSLRSDALPGWPERNRAGVVVAGLRLVFGDRLGRPWTFATHDMTDRHDLLVTWVSEWATDDGRNRARCRVDPRRPAEDRAHEQAVRRVDSCLDAVGHGEGRAGPARGQRGGARLPAEERPRPSARDHGEGAGPGAPRAPEPGSEREPEREPAEAEEPGGRASVYEEAGTLPAPPAPAEPAAPVRSARPPAAAWLRAALRNPRPDDEEGRAVAAWISGLNDRAVLALLQEEDLSYPATTQLLVHLFDGRSDRGPEARAELCAEALRQRLYLFRDGPEPAGDSELARRAGWLFGWAVSPYAREARHAEALDRWLAGLLAHADSVLEAELLRTLVPPPGAPALDGLPPDLAPALWQRLHHGRPAAPAPRPAPAPAPPPPPLPAPQEPSGAELPPEAPPLPAPARAEEPPPPQPPPAPAPAGPPPLSGYRRPQSRYADDQGDDRNLIGWVFLFLLVATMAIAVLWISRL